MRASLHAHFAAGAWPMWIKTEVWVQDKFTSNVRPASQTAPAQYSGFIVKYTLKVPWSDLTLHYGVTAQHPLFFVCFLYVCEKVLSCALLTGYTLLYLFRIFPFQFHWASSPFHYLQFSHPSFTHLTHNKVSTLFAVNRRMLLPFSQPFVSSILVVISLGQTRRLRSLWSLSSNLTKISVQVLTTLKG